MKREVNVLQGESDVAKRQKRNPGGIQPKTENGRHCEKCGQGLSNVRKKAGAKLCAECEGKT